jgi:hypothetical protein
MSLQILLSHMAMNLEALIAFLFDQGSRWVNAQRDGYRPQGRSLSVAESTVMAPFFAEEARAIARIVNVPLIANPDFYASLTSKGITTLLDFTQMSAITLNDTILIVQTYPLPTSELLPLLFHELVHVVQYELLGVPDFIRRYVDGWARNGFTYDSIPLERDAYELGELYTSNPAAPFSVHEEVRKRLALSA